MAAISHEFGYYPDPLDFTVGDITVTTMSDLDAKTAAVRNNDGVQDGWLYAPRQPHGLEQRPYASRIFGLPKTHSLSHAAADGLKHVEFLVWALSFVVGMRLTTMPMGFLDATPIKRRALTDFVVPYQSYPKALAYAEAFWQANKAHPQRASRWIGAVHALFIARYPQAQQFERFIYLYSALDACSALTQDFYPCSKPELHSQRVSYMCDLFRMAVPAWATVSAKASLVSQMRNTTFHEAPFMDAPLGGVDIHFVQMNALMMDSMERNALGVCS